MKKLILTLFSAGLLLSCSSDDGGSVQQDERDYFPHSQNASWVYTYNVSAPGVPPTGQQTVNIGPDRVIENRTYKVLDNTDAVLGTMTELPFIKNENNEVVIRPVYDFQGNTEFFDDLNFIQTEMIPSAFIGESTKEIIGEAMAIPDENVSGTVTPHTFITMSTQHISKPGQLAVNGVNYNNILHNKIVFEIRVVLDIDAEAVIGGQTVPIVREHEIISRQEYGTNDIWLAEDTGIIRSEYAYSFQDIQMNTQISLGGLTLDLLDIAPELSNFNSALNISGSANLDSYNP